VTDTRDVEADGMRYRCSLTGEGQPLLLLHGGLGSFDMFAPVLPILGGGRRVIGIDLPGHGRTELGSRSVNPIDMGGDTATVLRGLGFERVDVSATPSAPASRCSSRRGSRPWCAGWCSHRPRTRPTASTTSRPMSPR
jgi:hypothetical protein